MKLLVLIIASTLIIITFINHTNLHPIYTDDRMVVCKPDGTIAPWGECP